MDSPSDPHLPSDAPVPPQEGPPLDAPVLLKEKPPSVAPVRPPEEEAVERAHNFLENLKRKRLYLAGAAYVGGSLAILAALHTVLEAVGPQPKISRWVTIVLALGLGPALLLGWKQDRVNDGLPPLPRFLRGWFGWLLTAVPAALGGAIFFLSHPLPYFLPTNDKSIAVLPFETFSDGKDTDIAFFADGIQDEILTDLAKLASLKVISRSSVMKYKTTPSNPTQRNLSEIGQALRVAHIVEGSVERVSEKIRVTVRMVDPHDEAHQWSEHYDCETQYILKVQSQIANAVAFQLQAFVSPRERIAMDRLPTYDLKAYELYRRALDKLNNVNGFVSTEDKYLGAVKLLTEATNHDPNFARAFALMADTESLIYSYGKTTPEQADIVLKLAETVERLRPGSDDAHIAMGAYQYQVRRDYQQAQKEFSQAVQLSPSNAQALLYLGVTDRRLGLWDEALDRFKQAMEIDPENESIAFAQEDALERLHRYAEALARMEQWMTSHPQSYEVHLVKSKLFLAWKGDYRSARAELALLPPGFDPSRTIGQLVECGLCERNYAAVDHDLAAFHGSEIDDLPIAYYQGCTARFRGDKPAAEAAFNSARNALGKKIDLKASDVWSLMFLGIVDAGLGHKEQALEEARQASGMQPPEKDAMEGPPLQLELALVLSWVGEKDEAIHILQSLCSKQNGPNYGYLNLNPDWDALRGDNRFDSLVLSLKQN